MSTQTESRLAAALHARADLVTAQDLRPLERPARPGVRWRPVLLTTVAAAAVTAVVVTTAGTTGPAAGPAPIPPAASTAPAPSAASSAPPAADPAGDLAVLLPEVDARHGLGEPLPLGDGDSAVLRRVGSGDGRRYAAVLTVDGEEHTMMLAPSLSPPQLVAGLVRSPGGAPTVLVRQEDGDHTAALVLSFTAGAVTVLHPPAGALIGDGWTEVGDGSLHYYRTWLSERGVLYTAEAVTAARHRLTRWMLGDGSTLAPVDVGEACIDLLAVPPEYRRC
jgi:hypothetical protein